MPQTDSEEFLTYARRIRPIYQELFNLAHAVTGNSARAEYSLQYAMLECWSLGELPSTRHGFREALRTATLRAALKNASGEEEDDWDGLRTPAARDDALARLIAQESPDLRRLLALRYGCALPMRKCAHLAKLDLRRARQLMQRFEARARRTLPAAELRRLDPRIAKSVRGGLALPNPLAPDLNNALRTFQVDAASVSRPSRLPGRILRAGVAAVLTLLCMAVFWFAAVLLQPAVLEGPSPAEAAVESLAE